jgi:hypothetical protein
VYACMRPRWVRLWVRKERGPCRIGSVGCRRLVGETGRVRKGSRKGFKKYEKKSARGFHVSQSSSGSTGQLATGEDDARSARRGKGLTETRQSKAPSAQGKDVRESRETGEERVRGSVPRE